MKLTVPVPCEEPKLFPLIVTAAPTAPEFGDNEVMLGAGSTVNATLLLATLLTVITTLPVVAPLGTATTIELAPQVVGVAVVPLNLIVLAPWVEPKPLPPIVTVAPTALELGETLLMFGVTVNFTPPLAAPLTVTTTFPVVAALGTVATILFELQLAGVAVTPLKVTVLVPCDEPNALPEIVTEVPTFPDVGDKLVILGAACSDVVKAVQTTRRTAIFE